jgi:2-polyprenyl-6-methoxyphenol hydroxylase-like FAD-dependent oxidoreductase
MAVVGAYVLAGELALAGGDYRTAFARYEQECRSYMEQNQQIARKARELRMPATWEAIERQNEMLRATRPRAHPPRIRPETSFKRRPTQLRSKTTRVFRRWPPSLGEEGHFIS